MSTTSAGRGLAGKRILVLEDRLVNQTVIQGQLKALNIDCVIATNGISAFEALQKAQFDLVLCDCSMPEMDGYDFTRILRRREGPGQRIPIIALTANDSQKDVNESTTAGMDDFLSKPVTADKLATMLTKWLNPSAVPPDHATSAATPPDVSRPVINMRIFEEILGTSEVETLTQVLRDSLATVRASLAEVETSMDSGDPAQFTSAVRNAKGEARCVAAIDLANLYAQLERSAIQHGPAAIREMVARADTEVRRVEVFIRDYLGAHATP